MALSDEKLSAEEQVDLIKSEFTRAGADIADSVETYWRVNAQYSSDPPYLRMLYTKLDVLRRLQGNSWKYVDTSTGQDRVMASQVIKNLTTIMNETRLKIADLIKDPDEGVSVFSSIKPSHQSNTPPQARRRTGWTHSGGKGGGWR